MRVGNLPPVEPLPLTLGMRVRCGGDRWRWTVQAVSEHFAVLVRQVEFRPRGTLCYAVVDWRNGVRGPCNLVGQGWGDGTYTLEQCASLLAAFEGADEHLLQPLEVSHRNRVPIDVRIAP